MAQLAVVEEARALFTEGQGWSVLRWLAEKRRVRELADSATAALAASRKQAEAEWTAELRDAYAELPSSDDDMDDPFAAAEREYVSQHPKVIPEHVRALAKRVKQADDEALRATMKAEATFALAERRLSVALSKRGAEEAIESYDLRYKAIDEAAAAGLA